MTDDSGGSDDECCQRRGAMNAEIDSVIQSLLLGSERYGADGSTTSVSDNSKPMEPASLTDAAAAENQWDHIPDDRRDQPLALLDCAALQLEMSACNVGEREKVLSSLLPCDTVADLDSIAANASTCISLSLSHSSPDSGVYSKAVITPHSTVTESADTGTTSDFFKSSDDSQADAITIETKIDDDIVSDKTLKENLLSQTLVEACTAVEQSSSLDDDNQITVAGVRSSIVSTDTDDTINQSAVETEKRMLDASVASAVSEECVKCEDVNDVLHDRHQSFLGFQETSGGGFSDLDDEAVLKTVVAVHTKAVDRTNCMDSVKLFEPDGTVDIAALQNDGKGTHSDRGQFVDELSGERMLHGDADVDSSGGTEWSKPQIRSRNVVGIDDSQAEASGADTEGSSDAVDRNAEELALQVSPGTDELVSTMSTELDQYMTVGDPRAADTSLDSQTLDASASDCCQPLDSMASVKMFSEDEDLRLDSDAGRSQTHTGSFAINSNHSVLLSEVLGTEEKKQSGMRPEDVVEEFGDVSLGEQVQESLQDAENVMEAEIALTASMEDLRLRPSKKKLELLLASESVFLDPPDEYRDHQSLTENGKSFMSSDGVDLTADGAHWPTVDLHMQAKEDHLQRYLKSLVSLPDHDTAQEDPNSCQAQNSRDACSHDVSNSFNFGGESGAELPRHEHSTSPLVPELLHRCDNMAELSEDDYLAAQLQQYEVMKRHLMEEHHRRLERLLAEQERQMSLLRSRVMGQSVVSGSSDHSGSVAHKLPSTAVTPADDSDRCSNKPLPSDITDMFSSQNLIDTLQIPGGFGLGQVCHPIASPEPHVATSLGGMSSGHKMRSPAGVFYDDRQVISREPSCSTIRSGDTETEFAYKSPAVLRRSRRITPTCSPRSDQDAVRDSLITTHDNFLQGSTGREHPAVHSHRPNRRYVDMFAEASVQDTSEHNLFYFLLFLFPLFSFWFCAVD